MTIRGNARLSGCSLWTLRPTYFSRTQNKRGPRNENEAPARFCADQANINTLMAIRKAKRSALKSSLRSFTKIERGCPRSNLCSDIIPPLDEFTNKHQYHDERAHRLESADDRTDNQRFAARLFDRGGGDLHAQPDQAEGEQPCQPVAESLDGLRVVRGRP